MKIILTDTKELLTAKWEDDQVIMVMPCTDFVQATKAAQHAARRAEASGTLLVVYDTDRQGFIATANQAFRQSDSPLFGYMAQDAYAGRKWLYYALSQLDSDGSHKHLLAFNDGKWFGVLAAFGLARRSWAEKNYDGDLFCPEYKTHYADTELSVLAMSQGAKSYCDRSILIEVDWQKESKSVDSVDRRLYRERLNRCFDGRVTDPKMLNFFS